MHNNECFVKKIFEITRNIDMYTDRRIKEENLPILKSHILLFNTLPNGMELLSFNEVLNKVKFSKSSLSEIITKYETMGLLEKVNCKDDKRSIYIFLTEEGLKVKNKLDEILSQVLENLLTNFNSSDEDIMYEVINNIYSNSKKML